MDVITRVAVARVRRTEGQKDGRKERLQCGGRPSLLLCPAAAAAAVSVAGELRDTANCPGKGRREGRKARKV